jgi:hypothetical protein
MSSPEIGAVWGVFIGPLSPRKQTSVRFYAKVRFGSVFAVQRAFTAARRDAAVHEAGIGQISPFETAT